MGSDAEIRCPPLWSVTIVVFPRGGFALRSAVGGSISLTVFPAVSSVGLGRREAVGEGDRERVQCWLPPHGPSCPPLTGGVQ